MNYQINPIWVLVDDELNHVSDYAHLKPHNRPSAFCPVCKTPVIMKLGKKRVHHFAHHPGCECVLSNPETALHFNVKYYLYQQLQSTSSIFTQIACSGSCFESKQVAVISGWDDVQLEKSIGDYRPDIVLLREEIVIGAIEVYVTHRVDDEKAQAYENRFIRWLEIFGHEEIYEGDNRWTPDKPTPYLRIYPKPERWMCDACEERKLKAQAQQDYKRNNRSETHEGMMVDYYYPSGNKYRESIFIRRIMKDGQWVGAYVKIDDSPPLKKVYANPMTDSQYIELKKAAQEHIANKGRRTRAIVDIVADWRKWEKGQKFYAGDLDKYPFRYEWYNNKHIWYKV